MKHNRRKKNGRFKKKVTFFDHLKAGFYTLLIASGVWGWMWVASLNLIPQVVTYQAEAQITPITPIEFKTFTGDHDLDVFIHEAISQTDLDYQTFVAVMMCESSFQPYAENTQTHQSGVVSTDYSLMQVNDFYHGKQAEAMGLNIRDPRDNVIYAIQLMEREGLKPWSPSKKCWSNKI